MTISNDTTPEIEEVLARLARVVRRANAFVLGFVKCNSPAQQQQVRRSFSERLGAERSLDITLDGPIVSLLEELEAVVNVSETPDVVNVYGLEKSIYAHEDYSPALGRLNNDRDLIRRACPAVLLLWLPDYALDKVATSAPDFWAWRSGVYELPTSVSLWRNDSINALEAGLAGFETLSYHAKTAEVERVEELVRTAQSLAKQGRREQEIMARLLVRSAMLHNALGESDLGCQRLRDALALANELRDERIIQLIERMLAEQQYQLGNIGQAEQLFLHSVEDTTDLADPQGSTASYFRLGEIAEQRGEFDKAKSYYRRIAELPIAAANSITALALLAHIHQQQGELEEAFNIYQQMLGRLKLSDDKLRVATTLRQIGTLELQRGNLVEAEAKVSEALAIFEKFNEPQAAMTYGLLGQIKAEQGFAHEAFTNFLNAWEICQRLQLPNARLAIQSIISLGHQFGTEQLGEWIKDATSDDEQKFLDALNAEYDHITRIVVCSRVAAALNSNDTAAKAQLIQDLNEQFITADIGVQEKALYEALQGLLRGEQPSELSEKLSPEQKSLFEEVWRPDAKQRSHAA